MRIAVISHPISKFTEKSRGDKIAVIATPIARALKSSCIDPETKQLKKDSGCNKMKERLNGGMSVSEAMKLRWQGK